MMPTNFATSSSTTAAQHLKSNTALYSRDVVHVVAWPLPELSRMDVRPTASYGSSEMGCDLWCVLYSSVCTLMGTATYVAVNHERVHDKNVSSIHMLIDPCTKDCVRTSASMHPRWGWCRSHIHGMTQV
jgi:hypothetical protein